MSSAQKQRTKIIVRIRNPREADTKNSKSTTKSSAEDKKLNQTTTSVNKSTNLNKTAKSTIKSPANKTKSNNSSELSNKLNINANYTIFTSMERSNICVVTNNSINGKLVQETFQSASEIYDYSVNLMNDSSILEFDAVYNEQQRYFLNKLG